MSKIGNSGFTLVEVMLASCILALGTVMLYDAFLLSLDASNYYFHYLHLSSWVDQKLWDAKDAIARTGSVSSGQTSGELIEGNKHFAWNVGCAAIDQSKAGLTLFKIDVLLSWQEGRRPADISRSTYALYKKK